MSNTDTKTRILDAAEKLFARDGFHITSLRTLTDLAQVNLAAVNYHFGSKEILLQKVIERRLLPLNKIREEKIAVVLSQAQQAGVRPEVKDLLQAFIEPTLEFRNSGPGAEDFIALIGRSLSEPDETVRHCFIRQVLPLFKLLYEGLQQSLPELQPELLMTRLQFTMGAMSHAMCSGARPEQLIPGFPKPLPDSQLVEELVGFAANGLEASC